MVILAWFIKQKGGISVVGFYHWLLTTWFAEPVFGTAVTEG